jgi:hypothetical protein
VSDSLLDIVDALRAYADWQSAMRRSTELESRALRGQLFDDRRAHVRLRPIQLDRPMLARLKPGPLLTLLDVSAGGALIQTPARLTPGAHVTIEFLAPGTRRTAVVRSRVTRSHVAALEGCVRYRGACSFDELLELAEFLPPALAELRNPQRAATKFEVRNLLPLSRVNGALRTTTAGDALLAVRRVLTAAPGLDNRGIARLLEDLQRMIAAPASRAALITHVEGWLRKQVPLLALRIHQQAEQTFRGGDVLSFTLPVSDGSQRRPVNVEFRPACGLDDSQMRLLEAAACVMSILYATS